MSGKARKKVVSKSLLPDRSLYTPVKGMVEKALWQDTFVAQGTPGDKWAREVVGDFDEN